MCALPAKRALERLRDRGRARVFVDTCFLLDGKALEALDNELFELLHSWGIPAVITHSVATELKRHSESKAKPDLAAAAKQVLSLLGKHKKAGRIRLLGSEGEHFADQNFLEVFTRFRPKYDLVLFTNDRSLTRDLLRLNETESTSNYKTKVWVGWNTRRGIVATEQSSPPAPRTSAARPPRECSKAVRLFNMPRSVRKLDDSPVGGQQRFRGGDSLYTESGEQVVLGSALTPGGEAQPFLTESGEVAKIYHPGRRTIWRVEKLARMCANNPGMPNVAWPKALLYGSDKSPVGCLMHRLEGNPIQDVLLSKDDLEVNFTAWNRSNLTRVALDAARIVSALNERGIIVGDLHPNNFLVDGSGKVGLVDVDGAQIEDFPCEVGLPIFKAPEITEASYRDFLRTERHEAFALASLVFMILMGGKAPFSFQGGGDPAENIRAGNFPYVKDRGAIPAGAYRYIWSYFPPFVKSAFEQAFTSQNPSERPSTGKWVAVLERYCRFLESSTDRGALEIWPTDFWSRGDKSKIQLRCEECGTVFSATPADANKRRSFPRMLCNTCIPILALARRAGENHTCKKCGGLFRVPFGQVEKHGAALEVCDPCVTRIADEPRRCKNCGRAFTLEFGEVQFLLANGLSMPRKCGPCRGKPAGVVQKPQAQFEMRQTRISPAPRASGPKGSSMWDMLKSLFD